MTMQFKFALFKRWGIDHNCITWVFGTLNFHKGSESDGHKQILLYKLSLINGH